MPVKKSISLFSAMGRLKMGKKSWRETFGTTGVKVWPKSLQDKILKIWPSIEPNLGFGRTSVKSTTWSHAGQKDGFVIFGHRAPKMGKKSWEGNFWDHWWKGRKSLFSKFWKFDPWLHVIRIKPRFWPGECISLQNLMPMVRKVSPQDFVARFGRPTPKNSDSVVLTGVRQDGSNSRILT